MEFTQTKEIMVGQWQVLTVYEHHRIAIAEHFSADSIRPQITRQQAEELEEVVKNRGLNCCEFAASSIKFFQFVGIIKFTDWTLEILPKVDGVSEQSQVRQCLVDMLRQTRRLPIKHSGAAGLAVSSNDLLEVYARIFCEHLTEQLRKGIIRRYQNLEDNLGVVRGRILVPQQIRLNYMHPERVYCAFDEFCEDNAYNQLLKAALGVLQKMVRTASNQQLIRELLFLFAEVRDVPSQILLRQEYLITRLVSRFEDSLMMAKVILQGLNPEVATGKRKFFTMLFDMNVLFEEFIATSINKQFGKKVRSQGPCKYLLKTGNGRQLFQMRPDVTFDQGKTWILDTKWKLINTQDSKMNITQADLYQMLAYAVRYGCQKLILLYPHHSGLMRKPGVLEQFTMQGAHGEAMAILYIATIDLVRSDRQNFQRYIDHQLQNILEVVMRERDKAI